MLVQCLCVFNVITTAAVKPGSGGRPSAAQYYDTASPALGDSTTGEFGFVAQAPDAEQGSYYQQLNAEAILAENSGVARIPNAAA